MSIRPAVRLALAAFAFAVLAPFAAAVAADQTSAPRPRVDQVPMRHYVLALLRTGAPHGGIAPARLDSLRAGHMANIRKMFADHRLVCAGPFLDEGDLQGIYLFDADSVAQVTPWLAGDPFLATGHMVCELHPWYGPAGISEGYRKAAIADPTLADSLQRYTFTLLVRGPNWTSGDASERDMISRQLAGIGRKAQAGQIVLAGPLEDDGVVRGIAVFATSDTAEVRRWSETAPAIVSGRLRFEMHPWMTARGILAH